MNVLLIGHACGPGLGSEPGFTWNWAQALSADHKVWVIAYPEHRGKVESYLGQSPNANLHFIWVTTGHILDRWEPGRGERGIRLHYMLWLRKAYQCAAGLCRSAAIDVAHHVSWGTIGAPPPLFELPVPALWGPIGGGQTTPSAYLPLYGRRQWVEKIRTLRVKALRFSRRLRSVARQSKVIFATNKETAELLREAGAKNVRLLLDCGLPRNYVSACAPEPQTVSSEFTLLWAGRLEARKGLAVGLRAMAKIDSDQIKLRVAGSGPQQAELESLTEELGLTGRVQFLGPVPFDHMPALFQSSSAFLFTSLRDSFGSVVLEAMANGLPVVTLDHQGVGTFLPDAAAVKIPLSQPAETIEALSAAIIGLAASPELVRSMRTAAWNFANEQTWEYRAARMSEVYAGILEAVREPVPEAPALR